MDVILVDENDVPVGAMEKLEVHQKALLHRAFSVFIFNSKGDTTVLHYGPMPAAAILNPGRILWLLLQKDYRKKWVLQLRLKKHLILFTKPLLITV
jgi:hypothetical protein